MITETDIALPDGRTLHAYDTGPADLTLYWHPGTPQIGLPPADVAARPNIRWISHDRPGYGGSTDLPNRTVASVASDVVAVADALGVERFAVLGSSGGGPHALACGALLGDRVVKVACLASIAPYGVAGLDWFAGMAPSGKAELAAAVRGAEELRAHLAATQGSEPDWLNSSDIAMFSGPFGPWLVKSSTDGLAKGWDGFVRDDIAGTGDWGFDPADIEVPVLLLHGDQDRCVPFAHGEWLARRIGAELRACPGDGHISVFNNMDVALDWLEQA